MIELRDGRWYTSKEAVAKARALKLTGGPHLTPDGAAVLVFDRRGTVSQPVAGGPPTRAHRPPALVMQAADGHDLMAIAGKDRIDRVEFAPEELPDLAALVAYDDLPDGRKDYSVYPRGHKLAGA